MAGPEPSKDARREIQRRYHEKMLSRPDSEIPYPAEKRCNRCGEVKPADGFARNRAMPDGLKRTCKLCLCAEHAEKYAPKERKRRMGGAQMGRLGVEQVMPPVEDTPDGAIMRIPLTQGAFALIDAADWSLVAGHVWHLGAGGYATTNGNVGAGRRGIIRMHVLIAGTAEAPEVDHRNRNRLDNRRKNLRPATKQQQRFNEGKRPGGLSRFKGVRQLPSGSWEARISCGAERLHLGCFTTEEAAARAYDEAARRMFGEFAVPNFPAQEGPPPSG